ncbi:uncharacterized protein LOC116199261 [Punica granatum]|uniref:Uncharacterized protein n=2 Tax=Punica granatum TaxID=22663 RepID=A0A218Y2G1_PUNGR|nr:uncharacterized protein LOC116199261 [Punica granatum]OWM91475.1 hypothetical protein CDL15_Pgr017393 [Punica granatum]PKI79437.1 hypothetical protein CRG98_000184 [Punica granatum]
MPIANPRAGRVFVWIISCVILLSLASGGAFLVMYMTRPDPTNSAWLLYAGMALVCLPWFFWLMLCTYRCISRALGFRIICCGGGVDGAPSSRGGAGSGSLASVNRAGSLVGTPATVTNKSMGDTENGDGKQVNFGAAVVVNEGSVNNNNLRNIESRSSSSSSSNNDVSYKSHESEIPLASAMAS